MEDDYTIKEILNAVTELQDMNKVKKNKITLNKSFKKDYSSVPKDTLKLIEEAEKNKN